MTPQTSEFRVPNAELTVYIYVNTSAYNP